MRPSLTARTPAPPEPVRTGPAALDGETDAGWLVRPWLLVGVFGLVVLLRSRQVDIPLRDPHGEFWTSRVLLSAALLAGLSAVEAPLRAWRTGLPLSAAPRLWRERWTRHRLLLVASGLASYHLVYLFYHNLKSWDVLNAPRDQDLLRWDRWLFLGHSPHVLLHDLLGERTASYVLTAVYQSFGTLVVVSFVAALVFPARVRDGYVFIAAMLWIWVLGTACYYAIPSLGPFDSAPQEFAGLARTVVQDSQERLMAQRANLLADRHAPDAFAQVSAFASLHVGVTAVLTLMAGYYRLRPLAVFLWVFLAGTVVATVYLGYHFFLDDIAGFAIACLSVLLGRWLVYPPAWLGRQPEVPGRYESAPQAARTPEPAGV